MVEELSGVEIDELSVAKEDELLAVTEEVATDTWLSEDCTTEEGFVWIEDGVTAIALEDDSVGVLIGTVVTEEERFPVPFSWSKTLQLASIPTVINIYNDFITSPDLLTLVI